MTEITDEMVERYIQGAMYHAAKCSGYMMPDAEQRAITRAGLTAALSPPKPEIEVTPEMLNAGRAAMNEWWEGEDEDDEDKAVVNVYRAMSAYAAKPAPQGVSSGAPVKETGGGVLGTLHARKGEKKAHQHRRKDDATYVSFFSLDRA